MAYRTTPFHGKVARVEKNDVAVDFTTGYSVSVTLKMADQTSQGDNWDTALPGTASWNGSISGFLVLGNTQQKALVDNLLCAIPGTLITDIKLLLDTATNALIGDMYIIGIQIAPAIGSTVPVTFNFQGNGSFTPTNAA